MFLKILTVVLFLILFAINIVLLRVIFSLRNNVKSSRSRHDNISEYVSNIISTINSVRYGNLIARLGKHPDKNLNEVSKCINRMIETLNDREKMIVEYQGELKKKNDFLEMIINSLSDGLIILDENFKIIQATKNIHKWFGDTKKILNKDIFKYIKILNDKALTSLNNDEIIIENNIETHFAASVIKISYETKEKNYLMVVKDITNQKEIETLKEDFVATLTHDLKVPIIAESNMLNFLLSEKFGELNQKQKEAIKNMQTSNQELLDLVHIVLDTYRIKDGGITLFKEKIFISSLIDEVVQEMQPIADVSRNNLVVHIQNDTELFLDKIQMKRVLKNLIHNAISYGKTNSDIEIKSYKKDSSVILSVKDYGKGISKEDIEKIFNKYYSASKKFRKIGTGLGLYLSKEIVEAHGGDLVVKSEENKYTEFCIKFS